MVTVMLLPALRCLPLMLIQVPPERGPRAGMTCEKVGACQKETQSVHIIQRIALMYKRKKRTYGKTSKQKNLKIKMENSSHLRHYGYHIAMIHS